MNVLQKFDTGLNSVLNNYVQKPTIIRGIVHLLLVLYAVRLAPTPPKQVLKLFDNVYFKLFIFSLVLWTAQFSPSTSILIALAFMVTVNYSTTGKLWEMMDNTTSPISAVQVLSNAALSPAPASPDVIGPIAQIAASATTTQAGTDAVKALATQAITPSPGTPENVQAAVSTAVNSMQNNTNTNTTITPISAVQVLTNAALSPAPAAPDVIGPIAQVAASATTTQAGTDAVKALATQAIAPSSGTPENVQTAVETAVNSMQNNTVNVQNSTAQTGPVTQTQAIQAVQALSNAASSPVGIPTKDVAPVVNIAMSGAKTSDGVSAIQALAQQSVTPESGDPQKVDAATQVAISSITSAPVPAETTQPEQSGCYPVRNYDMTKVSPQTDGQWSFEDYQQFTSTPQ